jgi:formate-dependent nitrite reductase complex subunit NrfG
MHSRMLLVLPVAMLLVTASAEAAETAAQRKARAEALQSSLLAPCCYKEPVSRHQSEIAVKMQVEIARWVDEGRSDAEIVQTYKQLYGDKVYSPPPKLGLWVYLVPWLVLLAGGVVAVRWMRARLAPASPVRA